PLSLGFTVDPSRTFALLTYKLNITGSQTETSSIAIFLPSNNQYQLDCSSSTIATYLTYEAQIIEFDEDAGVLVQYINTLADGTETLVTLSTPVIPSRTSIFGGACRGPSTGAASNRSVAAD